MTQRFLPVFLSQYPIDSVCHCSVTQEPTALLVYLRHNHLTCFVPPISSTHAVLASLATWNIPLHSLTMRWHILYPKKSII